MDTVTYYYSGILFKLKVKLAVFIVSCMLLFGEVSGSELVSVEQEIVYIFS